MTALTHLPDRFVILPFRIGKENVPDWRLCIKYISINHSSNNTSSVEATLTRMNQLRSAIVQTCRPGAKSPPSESFIENTLKPYCQLLAMAQSHLPLYAGKVDRGMMFSWKNSFDDTHRNESFSAYLELLCCIYNLGASHAFVAAQQAQTGSEEGVKNAFQGFQHAAGYYDMAGKLLGRLPPEHVKDDLTAESLGVLRRMCLAMAHHCAYLKAEHTSKANHALLSKIAREGAKQYEEAASVLKGSAWYKIKKGDAPQHELLMTATSIIFSARAHLHLAASSMESGAMGAAIGHFEKAQKHLTNLVKMPTSELRTWVSSIINNVNKEHQSAISANETVYFSRVPKDLESPVGLPRALGKATEHTYFTAFESTRGDDPFFGIVPAHIAATASKWRESQRNIVAVCSKACASVRNMANEKMQTLGVTAAIEVLSGESQDRGKFPSQLYERIQSLHVVDGGNPTSVVESLVSSVKGCDNVLQASLSKIEQVKSELDAEKREEEAYVEAYGERMWRTMRRPSSELGEFCSIMSAIQDHEKGIQSWFVKPFSDAKSLLENGLRDIARLDWSKSDLDALMPFVKTKEATHQNQKIIEQVEELKKLVHKKSIIQESMDARLQELNTLVESDTVVFGLSSVEEGQKETILNKASQEITDAIERVNQPKRELEQIIIAIDEAMRHLGCLKSLDPVMEEVQKICNGLENACCITSNLRQEFRDILRYGASVLDAIEVTLSSAKSFTLSRKLEAEEFKEVLDAQIAQKMAEMQQNNNTNISIEDSRRRQEQLREQIAFLEQQQQQKEPERAERMAEIMRRQREVAAVFGGGSIGGGDGTVPAPPPPPPPPPPTDTAFDLPPPSYDYVINNSSQYRPI